MLFALFFFFFLHLVILIVSSFLASKVLDIEMRNLVEQFQYNAYLMPVSSMYGPQVDLPQVFDSTVFREQKDYFNFILRLLVRLRLLFPLLSLF